MGKQSFFYRILLPSLAAVGLFLAAMYIFVIPTYHENLMDKKRETIRELTNSAWSVLNDLHQKSTDSFSLAANQQQAARIIGKMRYGDLQKDYFWITDTIPVMIMHPYRPQMNGMNLSEYEDQEGKRFFVEITQIANESGSGYINYKWQWKDDSLMVVPKLSYVKLFEPWGWIIGTGIYVEDVKKEISAITRQLAWISFFITLIIGIIILYLARHNYKTEQQRIAAQQKQKETMEKYKKLIEASTDGVLMTMGSEIMYCNPYLMNLLGFNPAETDEKDERLLNSLHCILNMKNEPTSAGTESQEIIREHKIRKTSGMISDVIITRSQFDMGGQPGFIYTIKDVSKHKDVERELDLNIEKFKSIADRLNLGVFRCTLGRHARFIQINKKALQLLGYKSLHELEDVQVQEFFHLRGEKKEIIRAINESLVVKDRLLRIRKPDGAVVPVLLSLFPVKDAHDKSVYCDGIIMDAYEQLDKKNGTEKDHNQIPASILLKPVKEFMSPPVICPADTAANVVSRLMVFNKTEIALVKDAMGDIIGILTHGDLSRRVIAAGIGLKTPVLRIMSAPVVSVTEKDLVMDAFSEMVKHNISHVVVNRAEDKDPAFISLSSLSELRMNTPEYLIHSIEQAHSVAEVRENLKQLPSLIRNLTETGTGSAMAGKLISRISDTITIKFIRDAITEAGDPPLPFVFLALGSEGRREQSLATDQDNALVFLSATPQEDELHQPYFLNLGSLICKKLNDAGYPYCSGKVMSMNPQWCQSLRQFKEQVSGWINLPQPAELLQTAIFFDFRPVFGDFQIAHELQKHCLQEARNKNLFFYNLVQNIVNLKVRQVQPPKQVFGQGEKNADYFDVKEPLMIITAIVRLWALKFGITEKNTLNRLQTLQTVNFLSATFTEEFSQGFKYLTQMRISAQLQQIEENNTPGNQIAYTQLSEMDYMMMKKILSAISSHQARLATEFRIA
jgi:PAS domain S-box-containing protein